MNYIVKTKKLKSLINPLEQKINGLESLKEDIKSLLESNDLIINDTDSELTKFNKQVAFKVVNYKNEEIIINLPENTDSEFNSAELIEKGLVHLAATIYRNEENIIAKVEGNNKIAKALLGIDLSKPDNVKTEDAEVFIFLDLDKQVETLKQYIDDSDYEQKIAFIKEETEETKLKLLKEIPLENWNDENFIIKMVRADSDILGILPPEIVLQDHFLETLAFKTNISNFTDVFDMYFEKIFKLEIATNKRNEQEKYAELLNTKNNKLITLENLSSYKIEDWDDRKVPSDLMKSATKCIKDKIFNNLEVGIKLMSVKELSLYNDYYKFFSNEVQFNPIILEKVFDIRKKKTYSNYVYSPNIEAFITKEQGENLPWLKSLFKEYGKHLDHYQIERNPNMYISWYKDRDKIAQIFSTPLANELNILFKVIPEKIINDPEMSKLLIESCPLVYSYFNDKNKKLHLTSFIRNIDTFEHKDVYIENEDIYTLTNKEDLIMLLDKSYQKWLDNPECPKHLSEDMSLVFHKNVNFTSLLENKKIIKAILKDDKYITQALQKNKSFYGNLSYEKKLNVDFALLTLTSEKNNYDRYHEHLLNSKRFCLEGMVIDRSIISKASPILWNDKDFLLGVCEEMDKSSSFANKVLIDAPMKFSALFENYEVTSDYYNFMNSYIIQTSINNKMKDQETITKTKKKI